MSEFVAVIMAGGSGQRFWPLSTASKPKQFLDLERCGRSLLQATFDRLLPVTGSAERIFVVTGARYADLVCEQLSDLPPQNLLLEPVGRDTAPAIGFAALEVRARLGDPVMGVFPSDHRVERVGAFQETLRRAVALTRQTDGIITLGMQPDHPATGYGYIERGDAVGDGYKDGYKVARFVEKPDRESAVRYLETGLYSWNGGIFLWRASTVLDELARHAAELFAPLAEAHEGGHLAHVFPTLPKISIDYAVLEKTDRAYVLPADFGWDDVGDWNALDRLLNREKRELNTVVGQHIGLEATDNIVYTEDEGDMIVTLGVRDLIVVKRGNTVLLLHKERVQDIKKLLTDERLARWEGR